MLQPGLVGEEKWPGARPQSAGLWALLSVREIQVGCQEGRCGESHGTAARQEGRGDCLERQHHDPGNGILDWGLSWKKRQGHSG